MAGWDSADLYDRFQLYLGRGNGGVMDVNFLQEGLTAGSVDAPVNTYGFHASSNQLFHLEGGMIRATQLGSLCLGACTYL